MRLAQRLTLMSLVTTALCSPVAAADWGVGIASSTTAPGLSLQYGHSPTSAYHATVFYTLDRSIISVDWQRFFVPEFGRSRNYHLGFYSGLGLRGESERQRAGAEGYQMHLPLGIQYNLEPLRTSAFVEAAGLVGDLPTTSVSSLFMGGLRATF